MRRSFSIITVSKSRLEHVKLSLPRMLEQGCREVIVVDYSCPEGTGDYVEAHWPAAQVVRVPGATHFSNWKARNLGASAATGDVLVFCDADVILAAGAVSWLSDNLPSKAYGCFDPRQMLHLDRTGERLAKNQLRGFLAVPSRAFNDMGGFDEVLQGYAAGGDTDLADRLEMAGVKQFLLDPQIVESVVPHDNAQRTKHHAQPIRLSYATGLLYRAAKLSLLRLRNRTELPLNRRQELYQAAQKAAAGLGRVQDTATLMVQVRAEPVGMPRQLGYGSGKQTVSIKVEVSMEDKLPT